MFGKLRRKIQALKLEFAMEKTKVQDQDAEIKRLEFAQKIQGIELQKTKNELSEALDIINDPPFFRQNEQFGNIKILQVIRQEIPSMDILLPWLVLGLTALYLWRRSEYRESKKTSAEFQRKISRWKYRYYDGQSGQEYTMPEADLKEIIKLRKIHTAHYE